ncbi:ATP-dependent DNA helicase [Bifidobacterium platyrrhinorum]|uniref:DNA 3'-5' helicase n=1 Tax=Bifidobacterium platyrrhinorum TaxID=2661628 RepID=A0A6L9STD4_9BIFI|nr:ATP-dependent DNA helicase [Bifidobacterium platyrrhinorum]NEG55847.1 AAA family ATPase [Bifidobacterium platyrrhinorum]
MSARTTFTDSPEQAAVINAPVDDDVLVVAGAGSGKTYTMTRRIIELIRRGVAPERILGLTFTRKAAGELLSRVSAAVLADRGEEAGGDDRMFLKPAVYTYDAFFQTIVRQYGLLVGFDQNTQPLSEAGALQLAANVIDRHMGELRGLDLGAFGTLASRVLALSNAIGSAMIGEGVPDMDTAVARVRAWDRAFIDRVREALGDRPVPDAEPKIRAPRRLKKDTDATWAAKLEEHHRRLRDKCVWTCAGLVGTAERREALLGLVEAYTAEKRRLNMAEFGDFTIAAYQLVTRFPSIGERYRRRFGHVLLDEYQDTSTTQAALLATLFRGGTAVNAVGDPFQSIYAWRGASPGAFRMFQQDFHMPRDAKPYALSVTRRNSRLVLEAANDLTLPLRGTPRRPGSSLLREVEVAPLDAMPSAPEGTLGVLGYDTLGQEVDAVVRFCRQAVRPHGIGGIGGPGPEGTASGGVSGEGPAEGVAPPPRRTAAVLFRSKKNMDIYRQALESAGLSTLVVGYSAMLDRPEIRDVLALLHVVADHTDAGSLMRLLATPRFGLAAASLASLASLADALNTQARYQALVAAGLASGDEPRDEWASLVREHRDAVANAVFLPDVLLGDGLASLLGDGGFPESAVRAIAHAGRMLRQVHDVVGRPLPDVVRAAVQALDLDIDTVVAQALRSDGSSVNPTLAHLPMDAVIDLVDTYTAEIAADSAPTLRGFMAWTDALRSIDDETSAFESDRGADVELMTVHQSKGLEWDAVAIVGLAAGTFPSNQGNHLKVTLDERHPGGTRAARPGEPGGWEAPEYHEEAGTWLDDPTAVPAPMRADAGILPRFPHDAPVGGDPIEALDALDDVELIDDEVYGSLRGVGDGVDDVDPDSWYLTQAEEYGRRLHADERRLMYVALTRAKRDVLLTYSRSSEPGRDPSAVRTSSRKAKPSDFWLEVHDALHPHAGTVMAEDVDSVDSVDSDGSAAAGTLDALGAPRPDGFFTGEDAASYAHAVIGGAWSAPLEERRDGTLPWPASLSAGIAARLEAAADAVAATESDAGAAAKPDAGFGPAAGASSGAAGRGLLDRARLLIAEGDLMNGAMSGADLDRAVRDKAQRILAGSRQSVTRLQTRAGDMGEREERRYWRGIVRPIPSVASPSASAGTRFHAWAERFLDAGIDGYEGLDRASMIDDLRRREDRFSVNGRMDGPSGASPEPPTSGRREHAEAMLAVWERRLVESPWASRTPAWAERQLVVAIPELDGIIANGKLDAVFHGGFDPADPSKRYTVIDWKTGHRPRKPRDIAEKLVQLDLYRLLLSAMEGVPLDSIDAALYYVSEPDARLRELRAEEKTEQEIIAELSSGIPGHTDDD